MKKVYDINWILWVMVFLGLVSMGAGAANRYSVASGNWTSTAVWSASSGGASGASVPVASDNVFIEKGYTVTLNTAAASCTNLSITPPLALGTSLLSIGVNTLNVSGSVTLNGSNSAADISRITITTGTLAITGNLVYALATNNASILIDMSGGAGFINLWGDCTGSTTGSFTSGAGSTFSYKNTAAQLVGAFVYNNLYYCGSGVKTQDGNVTVNGTLSMQGTATASPGAGSLTYGPSSTLEYKGTAFQITGPELSVASKPTNLTINNPVEVQLNVNSIIITGVLTLTAGEFDLNKNTFTVNNTSSSAITAAAGSYIFSEDNSLTAGKANNASRLKWNLGNTASTFIFPFGTAAGDPVPVTITQGNPNNAGYVTVSTYHSSDAGTPYPQTVNHLYDNTGSHSDNSANTVNRFWEIAVAGPLPTLAITFTYVDDGNASPTLVKDERPTDGTGGYETNLKAQAWSAAGDFWKTSAATASGQFNSTGLNTVLATGVTSFGIFTLAKGIHPLPLELKSFNAHAAAQKVNITWTTYVEYKCSHFEIERSTEGAEFDSIGSMKASNVAELTSYQFIDPSPVTGISYYRLKQVDLDGTFTFTAPQYIHRDAETTGKFTMYPNPLGNGRLFYLKNLQQKGFPVLIKILDLQGNTVYEYLNTSEDTLSISTSHLNPGIYLLYVSNTDHTETERIILQ